MMEKQELERLVKGHMEREKKCVIARLYATSPEKVSERVKMAKELAENMRSLKWQGRPIFKQVIFVVPTDPSYRGRLDCGQTVNALKKTFREDNFVRIRKIKKGGPFCYALNESLAYALRSGYHYAHIISVEARNSLNYETMMSCIEAAAKGALYAGVAFDDLAERVYAGHIMNTNAYINIYEALSVGGFSPMAEMAVDDIHMDWKHSYDETGVKRFYPKQGCEEGTLIACLYNKHNRPVTAPIKPKGDGIYIYAPAKGDEERHQDKVHTKTVRIESLLYAVGSHPSVLRAAILPDYRKE